jgi:SAM-dependent methyltransferase
MVAMARRRNAAWEGAGKVDLRLGSIADVERFGRRFDKVLAVNVVQFWKEPVAAFGVLRAVMRPGGRVAFTVQPRWRGARPEDARRSGDAIAAALTSAGFGDVRIEILPLRPMPAACVLGTAQ